jgi:membrane associated rhomboid family serine protease
MDITPILTQYGVSILAVCIMIGALVIAYVKKFMITFALIFANLFVFFISVFYPIVIYQLGFSPIYLQVAHLDKLYTLFTSMFIHADLWHLVGNMLVFFFMGMAFEQRIGQKKFLIIYLLTGVCGTLTHSVVNLGEPTILIGASGAIFGILGAFAFSYPRDEVVMPIPLGIIMVFRRIKVIYGALLFAGLETVIVLFGAQDNTAHFAHLGGLLSGVVLAAILIRGVKTHTKEGKTIYYDSFTAQKPKKINFSDLQKLATTPEQKELLQRIEQETVPQVRDVWLEHLLEKTVCPKCNKPLNHFDGKIWCEYCEFKAKY